MSEIDWEREIDDLERLVKKLRHTAEWLRPKHLCRDGQAMFAEAKDDLENLQRQLDLIKWRLVPPPRRLKSAQVNRELAWPPVDF